MRKSEKSGPVRDWEVLYSRRLRAQLGLVVRALVSVVHLTEGCWRYSPSVFWERSIVSLH
jgi:hypothetical protein